MPFVLRTVAVPVIVVSLGIVLACGADPQAEASSKLQGLAMAKRADSIRADSISRFIVDSAQKAKARQEVAQELKRLESEMGVSIDKFDESRAIGITPRWGERAAERGWTFTLGLFQKQGSKPTLVAAAATKTEEWLFWDEFVFNVDGTIFTLDAPTTTKNTHVNYGSVSEWWVGDVYHDDIPKFMGIATGKTVKLRFRGRNGLKDVTLGAADKRRIGNALKYAALYNLVYGEQ